MKAGKTDIEVGTRIKTTKQWGGRIVTGTITHTFGCFGGYDFGAIAGIHIDKKYQNYFVEIGNLRKGDFEVIE